MGKNINNTKKKTEALLGASKEVGLGVNAEKIRYTFITHCHNTGQNHNIKVAKQS
jgi:hypothetical protein